MYRGKTITLLIIIIISTFIYISCGSKHTDPWREYNDLGIKLMKAYRYCDAEQAFKRAISIERQIHGPGTVKEVISNLHIAHIYYKTDNDSTGKRITAAAMVMLDSLEIEFDSKTLDEFISIARKFSAVDAYAEAALIYSTMESFYISYYGEISANRCDLLSDLAEAYADLNEYSTADSLWQVVLSLHHQLQLPDIGLYSIYDNMAEIKDSTGQRHEADSLIALADEALYRNAHLVSRRLAGMFITNAELSLDDNDFAKAERYYNRALAAYDTNGWKPDRDISRSYANLGEICRIKGNLNKADSFLNLANDINNSRGYDDEVNTCIYNIRYLINIHKTKEAEAQCEKCLSYLGRKEVATETICEIYCLNGEAKRMLGKYDEAKNLLETADSIANNSILFDKIYQAYIYKEMALLYNKLKNYSEAEKYIYLAIDVLAKEGLQDSWQMALYLTNLAEIRKKQGFYENLDTLYEKAFALYDEMDYTWYKGMAMATLYDTGYLYYLLGDSSRAFAKCNEAILYAKTQSQDNSPTMAHAKYSLGELYKLYAMYDDAEKTLKEAAAIYELYPGAYDYDLERVYRLIAGIYIRRSNTHGATEYNHKAAMLREKMNGDSTITADN